jgi:hypothetical protein
MMKHIFDEASANDAPTCDGGKQWCGERHARIETARVTDFLAWGAAVGAPRWPCLTSQPVTNTISAPHQDDRCRVGFLFSRTVLHLDVPERANAGPAGFARLGW